ncbi:Protein transport protein Sec24B [Thelohanellus kitauei]|uniref:Protein transport protein Sec24B n=1 Tax=Thelohanellus kitauei TaxID=669202 RepID=A0A0C2MJ51_THEKT|nr:Protein transport protein Sec24B [Thelohanellus kitauei]
MYNNYYQNGMGQTVPPDPKLNPYASHEYQQNRPTEENIDLSPLKSYINIYEHGIHQNQKNFLQSTVSLVSVPKKKFDKTRIPLGLVYTPFMTGIPITRLEYHRMVRCRVCMAYLNPYVKIIDERSYYCSVCFAKNNLEQSAAGFGFDLLKRPELQYTNIEYDSEIGARNVPLSLSLVFLVDTSHVDSDCHLKTIAESLLNNLGKIPSDKRSAIAFITFDTFIHTYHVDVKEKGYEIEHNIITDLNEPFYPSHESDFIRFNVDDRLKYFLSKLPDVIKINSAKDTDNCFGSALIYCTNLLQRMGGGRLTAFLSKPPNTGLYSYQVRNNSDDNSCMKASIDYYRKFALDILEKNISIDIFGLGNDGLDLSNLVPLSQITGGDVFISTKIDNSYRFKIWLKNTLETYLQRELRLTNSVKIRMNENYENYQYLGNFMANSFSKISFPVTSQYTTITMQIQMVSNPPRDFSYNCFQASIYYTSFDGNC